MTDDDAAPGYNRSAVEALWHLVGDPEEEADDGRDDGGDTRRDVPAFEWR